MELQIFTNEQFGQVRTLELEGQPYFLGNDVASILGYKRTGDAIKQHVDEEDRKTLSYKAFGDLELSLWKGNDFSNKTFITESGVYSLIFGSELPQAKQFKRWVTSEVLPTIRKHGAYMTDNKIEEALLDPDTIINLAKQLKAEREEKRRLQLELEEAQKQARYLDLIIESKGSVRVTQIAADYGMSAKQFNKVLHELGVQHKVNGQWILYKKHMGKGYTDSTTFDYEGKDGIPRVNMTTTWTQKGRLFLYELLKASGILPMIEREDVA